MGEIVALPGAATQKVEQPRRRRKWRGAYRESLSWETLLAWDGWTEVEREAIHRQREQDRGRAWAVWSFAAKCRGWKGRIIRWEAEGAPPPKLRLVKK